MTVKQLKQLLSQYDDSLNVVLIDEHSEFYSVADNVTFNHGKTFLWLDINREGHCDGC